MVCFNGTHLASRVSSALLLSCALQSTAFPRICTLLTSWDSKHILFFLPHPPSPFIVFICAFLCLKSEEKVQFGEKSSQILALPHQCLQTLFYRFWIELWTFWRGSSWNDFILDCARHYMRSILLLYCVDVGLQSLQHSSCKQYLGVISPLSSVFLNIVSFTDDRAFSRKWNQTSPKSAKKTPSASAPPSPSPLLGSSIRPFFFVLLFTALQRVDLFLLSFSLRGNAIHCRPSVYWHESIDIFVYVL